MRIQIVTPAPRGSRGGNRLTARRWGRVLRDLGHTVTVGTEYQRRRCDLLVALHARKSYPSVRQFCRDHPNLPLIVALTGTDLYGDVEKSQYAQRALELATRLIVLQPCGIDALPAKLRPKANVIFQSADRPPGMHPPKAHVFEVCVLGHLRPVKDPFRTGRAARLLPATSRIQIIHVGAALSSSMKKKARAEAVANPRYRWLGERPRWQALRLLARSRLLVLTSKSEGGANVISEALAASVPILSSEIPGAIGILGRKYPGYFPTGDTLALAELLERAEQDREFYRSLLASCDRVRPLIRPARERESWASLMKKLSSDMKRVVRA